MITILFKKLNYCRNQRGKTVAGISCINEWKDLFFYEICRVGFLHNYSSTNERLQGMPVPALEVNLYFR